MVTSRHYKSVAVDRFPIKLCQQDQFTSRLYHCKLSPPAQQPVISVIYNNNNNNNNNNRLTAFVPGHHG